MSVSVSVSMSESVNVSVSVRVSMSVRVTLEMPDIFIFSQIVAKSIIPCERTSKMMIGLWFGFFRGGRRVDNEDTCRTRTGDLEVKVIGL